MGAVARSQIEALQAQTDAQPEWFLEFCANVAEGDTLDMAYAKLTNRYEVGPSALLTWIRSEDSRNEKYEAALGARAYLRRERAAANVARMAVVQHADEDVSPGDTLKAADMVLNPKQGFVVGAGSGGGSVKIEVEFVAGG